MQVQSEVARALIRLQSLAPHTTYSREERLERLAQADQRFAAMWALKRGA